VSGHIDALVALADGATSKRVASALPDSGDFEIVAHVHELTPDSLREKAADIVVVACTHESRDAIGLIEAAIAQRPDRPVVILQLDKTESSEFMQQVFAAGADDIVVLPEPRARVRRTLLKAIARKRVEMLSEGSAPAPVIGVLGPKGGTGKTVTACNLAVAMAERGRRPILVDLDLHFGDVGIGLQLTPERTIYDLACAGGTLDTEKLVDFLTPHSSGVRALLAPVRPEQAGSISTDFITEMLALARAAGDAVIVDTEAGFASEVIAVVDSSTAICMVAMLDAFSLKDTKLGLETLELMGYDSEAVRVVFNRADSRIGIDSSDVQAILGRRPDVLIPSQREIPRSVTEGRPIVTSRPDSEAAAAFRSLASLFLGEPVPGATKQPERSRSRWSIAGVPLLKKV
jgi:pilus assembly protein CpaE